MSGVEAGGRENRTKTPSQLCDMLPAVRVDAGDDKPVDTCCRGCSKHFIQPFGKKRVVQMAMAVDQPFSPGVLQNAFMLSFWFGKKEVLL